jgi:hypothetical protein
VVIISSKSVHHGDGSWALVVFPLLVCKTVAKEEMIPITSIYACKNLTQLELDE